MLYSQLGGVSALTQKARLEQTHSQTSTPSIPHCPSSPTSGSKRCVKTTIPPGLVTQHESNPCASLEHDLMGMAGQLGEAACAQAEETSRVSEDATSGPSMMTMGGSVKGRRIGTVWLFQPARSCTGGQRDAVCSECFEAAAAVCCPLSCAPSSKRGETPQPIQHVLPCVLTDLYRHPHPSCPPPTRSSRRRSSQTRTRPSRRATSARVERQRARRGRRRRCSSQARGGAVGWAAVGMRRAESWV